MTLREKILKYSRQDTIGELAPWFSDQLDWLIEKEYYQTEEKLKEVGDQLVQGLVDYKNKYNINNVCLGMSGGVDSALTAALFKSAGWNVHGIVMPIHQNPDETARGIEACKVLGIDYNLIDLTNTYEKLLASFAWHDPSITAEDQKLRRGNLRVRLRMMTVYNEASACRGLVGSTDNFSELAAGFWTLHGDVGDLAPIQSLYKSWEVPKLAELYGVPTSTVFAKPTDGLGISGGDEDQFGFSYLEFDIVLMMAQFWADIHSEDPLEHRHLIKIFAAGERSNEKISLALSRIKNSTFKRYNPFNLPHPTDSNRYNTLTLVDQVLHRK